MKIWLWLLLMVPALSLADSPAPAPPPSGPVALSLPDEREARLRIARRRRGAGIALVIVGALIATAGAVLTGYGAAAGGDAFGIQTLTLTTGVLADVLGTSMWISGAVLWIS